MNKVFFLFLMLSLVACKTKDIAQKTSASQQVVPIDNNRESFSMELTSNGIVFKISVIQEPEDKVLSVSTIGLKQREYAENFNIIGEIVVDAELADLNMDNSPELLIYTQSVGSGSYGKVYAFSVNNLQSMSQVYMPPFYEDEKIKQGYMGHDEFEVVENTLIQHFPIYELGDSNAKPTGGVRKIFYQLVDGEASRRLVPTKIIEEENNK